jgi:hypothetical protein
MPIECLFRMVGNTTVYKTKGLLFERACVAHAFLRPKINGGRRGMQQMIRGGAIAVQIVKGPVSSSLSAARLMVYRWSTLD